MLGTSGPILFESEGGEKIRQQKAAPSKRNTTTTATNVNTNKQGGQPQGSEEESNNNNIPNHAYGKSPIGSPFVPRTPSPYNSPAFSEELEQVLTTTITKSKDNNQEDNLSNIEAEEIDK